MTKQQQQWEEELKAAGWKPTTVHPNSPTWREPGPDGRVFPGPGYAWEVMKGLHPC